jgi:hypothetical protein
MMIFRNGSWVMAAVLLAGASFAARPAAAAAGDTSRAFNLKATVAAACSFEASGASWSQQQSVTTGDANSATPSIDFTPSITATGATNATAEWKSKASCNVRPNISLTTEKGAMMGNGLNQTNGFLHYMAYQAVASWGGQNVNIDANTPNQSRTQQQSLGSAMSGDFTVRFTTQASNTPYLAGTYTDVLTVTIQPTT